MEGATGEEYGYLHVPSIKKKHSLKPGRLTVGSGLHANFRIYGKDIEPIHCIIEVHQNRSVTLTALSNLRPTMLNDKTVRRDKTYSVSPGNIIQVGGIQITYQNSNLSKEEISANYRAVAKPSLFNTPFKRKSVVYNTPMSKILKSVLGSSRPKSAKIVQRRESPRSLWTSDLMPKKVFPSNRGSNIDLNTSNASCAGDTPNCNMADTNTSDANEASDTFLHHKSSNHIDFIDLVTPGKKSLASGFIDLVTPGRRTSASVESNDFVASSPHILRARSRTPAPRRTSEIPKSILKRSRSLGAGKEVYFADNSPTSGRSFMGEKEEYDEGNTTNSSQISSVLSSSFEYIASVPSPSISISQKSPFSSRKESGSSDLMCFSPKSERSTARTKPRSSRKFVEDKTNYFSELDQIEDPLKQSSEFSNADGDSEKAGVLYHPRSSKKMSLRSSKTLDVSGITKLLESPAQTVDCKSSSSSMLSLVLQDQNDPRVHKEGNNKIVSRKRKVQNSPRNELTDLDGVKELFKPSKDNLTDVTADRKLLRTPKVQKTPYNDLSNVSGVKRIMQTPKIQRSPVNDLSNVMGVKKLASTPKVKKSPRNDLTELVGIKKIFRTPKEQKPPRNDLSNPVGLKELFSTPKQQNSPKNDLTNPVGVKKLLQTPKNQKQPDNDLSDPIGIKKLLKTPKVYNSPKNDLTNPLGLKKLLRTPKEQKEARNDLSNPVGIKKLLCTPKVQKPPKNDLTNPLGIKKLLRTPKEHNGPKNDLSNLVGVKKLLRTPKIQKSPKNDLNDLGGIKKLFTVPKVINTPEDFSDLPALFCEKEDDNDYKADNTVVSKASEDAFDALINKKPLKTYRGKSTSPMKLEQLKASKEGIDLPTSRVSGDYINQWIETHMNYIEKDNSMHEIKQSKAESVPSKLTRKISTNTEKLSKSFTDSTVTLMSSQDMQEFINLMTNNHIPESLPEIKILKDVQNLTPLNKNINNHNTKSASPRKTSTKENLTLSVHIEKMDKLVVTPDTGVTPTEDIRKSKRSHRKPVRLTDNFISDLELAVKLNQRLSGKKIGQEGIETNKSKGSVEQKISDTAEDEVLDTKKPRKTPRKDNSEQATDETDIERNKKIGSIAQKTTDEVLNTKEDIQKTPRKENNEQATYQTDIETNKRNKRVDQTTINKVEEEVLDTKKTKKTPKKENKEHARDKTDIEKSIRKESVEQNASEKVEVLDTKGSSRKTPKKESRANKYNSNKRIKDNLGIKLVSDSSKEDIIDVITTQIRKENFEGNESKKMKRATRKGSAAEVIDEEQLRSPNISSTVVESESSSDKKIEWALQKQIRIKTPQRDERGFVKNGTVSSTLFEDEPILDEEKSKEAPRKRNRKITDEQLDNVSSTMDETEPTKRQKRTRRGNLEKANVIERKIDEIYTESKVHKKQTKKVRKLQDPADIVESDHQEAEPTVLRKTTRKAKKESELKEENTIDIKSKSDSHNEKVVRFKSLSGMEQGTSFSTDEIKTPVRNVSRKRTRAKINQPEETVETLAGKSLSKRNNIKKKTKKEEDNLKDTDDDSIQPLEEVPRKRTRAKAIKSEKAPTESSRSKKTQSKKVDDQQELEVALEDAFDNVKPVRDKSRKRIRGNVIEPEKIVKEEAEAMDNPIQPFEEGPRKRGRAKAVKSEAPDEGPVTKKLRQTKKGVVNDQEQLKDALKDTNSDDFVKPIPKITRSRGRPKIADQEVAEKVSAKRSTRAKKDNIENEQEVEEIIPRTRQKVSKTTDNKEASDSESVTSNRSTRSAARSKKQIDNAPVRKSTRRK